MDIIHVETLNSLDLAFSAMRWSLVTAVEADVSQLVDVIGYIEDHESSGECYDTCCFDTHGHYWLLVDSIAEYLAVFQQCGPSSLMRERVNDALDQLDRDTQVKVQTQRAAVIGRLCAAQRDRREVQS